MGNSSNQDQTMDFPILIIKISKPIIQMDIKISKPYLIPRGHFGGQKLGLASKKTVAKSVMAVIFIISSDPCFRVQVFVEV